jgi:hypothetical protein
LRLFTPGFDQTPWIISYSRSSTKSNLELMKLYKLPRKAYIEKKGEPSSYWMKNTHRTWILYIFFQNFKAIFICIRVFSLIWYSTLLFF